MHNGVKVLDVHGHISQPPQFLQHAALLMASNGPYRPLQMSDEQLEEAQQRHLRELDLRQVDVQLIGPRPFAMFQHVRPHIQEAWCRTTNDLIARACRLHPDRFLGMAQLPQNVDMESSTCVPELERAVKELGFVGAYLNPDPDGQKRAPGVDDAYWSPLYAKAQELDVPLMVHPSGTFDRRVERLAANYQINNVTEEYIATQLYSRGDVFDRFPGLRIIVCHCGGSLDRWIKTDPHLGQKDLSGHLFFDTCAHDEAFLTAAIKQRGVDQTLFGTEVPGSGGALRPESGRPADDLVPVIDGLPFLSDEDKRKIFNANAKRVFPRLAQL